MPRPTLRKRDPISIAVLQLRRAFGENQQQFANRTGLAITTIARYETSRPPQREALQLFFTLAREKELNDLAETFRKAMPVSSVYLRLGALASATIPGINAKAAVLLNHLKYRKATPKAKIDEAINTLEEFLPELEKLNLYLPWRQDPEAEK